MNIQLNVCLYFIKKGHKVSKYLNSLSEVLSN